MFKKLLALCLTAGVAATAFGAPPMPPFDRSGSNAAVKPVVWHPVHHKHHRHHRHHHHHVKHM
ncbi:MAG: hypothetical protein HGA47_13230 [Zoogloea sp.]|nr:hypothetical protein [Zoogloea sp.]